MANLDGAAPATGGHTPGEALGLCRIPHGLGCTDKRHQQGILRQRDSLAISPAQKSQAMQECLG